MDAKAVMQELELLAWELAEAERHESIAKRLRTAATRRAAVVHSELKTALDENQKRRILEHQH